MKKKGTGKKKDISKGLEDERFAHLKSDPKFSGLSKKNKKVVIEKRFAAALTDAKFSSRAPVDKRGRQMKKTTGNDLLDLYEVESESDEERPVKKARKDKPTAVEKQDTDSKPKKLDLARGEGNISSSDESDSDSEWELPDEVQQNMNLASLDHDAEKVEWASSRLAACNLDWNLIKAEDILILVNSFKPSGGKIESVSIYLSDFGKERLEEENKYGPRLKISKPIEDIEEGDELDPETKTAVRQYQLDLLKYYYAVIECDSEETATAIYEQCDGFQFETSGLKMDLRFIPPDMEFNPSRRKETMSELDLNLDKYKSKEKILSSVARTDSKVAWDENDEERAKKFMEAFNDEDEAAGLIADSDSDDEETVERRKKALRALLDEDNKDEEINVEWDDKEQEEDDEEESAEEDVKEDVKEEESDNSDIEKALARRGEEDSDEDSGAREEITDEDASNRAEPVKKKNKYTAYLEKRKQKRKERKQKMKETREAEREELEQAGKDANERQQITKAKKTARQTTDETVEKVVADDRFGALFTDSAFAIEQSAKQFKGSKLIEKQASAKKQSKSAQNASDDIISKLKAKANQWEQKKQKKK